MVHLAREAAELVYGPDQEPGFRTILRKLPLHQRVEDELLGLFLCGEEGCRGPRVEGEGCCVEGSSRGGPEPRGGGLGGLLGGLGGALLVEELAERRDRGERPGCPFFLVVVFFFSLFSVVLFFPESDGSRARKSPSKTRSHGDRPSRRRRERQPSRAWAARRRLDVARSAAAAARDRARATSDFEEEEELLLMCSVLLLRRAKRNRPPACFGRVSGEEAGGASERVEG